MMESTVPEYGRFGDVRSRTGGALPGIVPSNTYTCADGAAIVIAGNGDAIFKRLMRAIGGDDLADDPALDRNEGRVRVAQQIDDAIQAWCERHAIDGALAVLKAADVPVSRIYSVADMFEDPQYAARRMIESHRLPDGTPIRMPAVVPKLSATPGGTEWMGPRLGEHTDEILHELGYPEPDIAELRRDRVI